MGCGYGRVGFKRQVSTVVSAACSITNFTAAYSISRMIVTLVSLHNDIHSPAIRLSVRPSLDGTHGGVFIVHDVRVENISTLSSRAKTRTGNSILDDWTGHIARYLYSLIGTCVCVRSTGQNQDRCLDCCWQLINALSISSCLIQLSFP